VEVNPKKGLSKVVQINMDGWSHQQAQGYEKLPLKCNTCHEYGHFTKSLPRNQKAQSLSKKPLKPSSKME